MSCQSRCLRLTCQRSGCLTCPGNWKTLTATAPWPCGYPTASVTPSADIHPSCLSRLAIPTQHRQISSHAAAHQIRQSPSCMPSLIYLFSDVQTEAVTVSVVQLLRVVMRRLLSAHVVNGPAAKVDSEGLGWSYVWLTDACHSSLQQVVTYVYSIIYCSALKEVSFSPSSNLFSLLIPDCTNKSTERKKGAYSLELRMFSQSELRCPCEQVLRLTAICDQPSSRSTTLRSFIFENGVTLCQGSTDDPRGWRKRFDLPSRDTKQPCSAAARPTRLLVVEVAEPKQASMISRKPNETGTAINFYGLRSEVTRHDCHN